MRDGLRSSIVMKFALGISLAVGASEGLSIGGAVVGATVANDIMIVEFMDIVCVADVVIGGTDVSGTGSTVLDGSGGGTVVTISTKSRNKLPPSTKFSIVSV